MSKKCSITNKKCSQKEKPILRDQKFAKIYKNASERIFMALYGLVWPCMALYGLVWPCDLMWSLMYYIFLVFDELQIASAT